MRGRGLAVVDGAWMRRGCVALLAMTVTLVVACTHGSSDPWTFEDAGPADAWVMPACDRGTLPAPEAVVIQSSNTLRAIAGYTSAPGIVIEQCDDCVNLDFLSCLTSVGGDLRLVDNQALDSVEGLHNVTSIGSLTISDSDALTSLDGLNNLATVGWDVTISDNDALTSLQGLESLNSFEGMLEISGNDALTSLTGLDNLAVVQGFVDISDNDALTSLHGLDNLVLVQGWFWGNGAMYGALNISDNDALTSLDGLDGLAVVQGTLAIHNNVSLTSVAGLNHLYSAYEFGVSGNDMLPDCEVCQLFSQLTPAPTDITAIQNLNDSCTPVPDNCP